MFDNSRSSIYDYLYDLLFGVVTENVYEMKVPKELTDSDVQDGFVVTHVGEFRNNGEFETDYDTYGTARVYIEAYVPPKSRGRLDIDKFRVFENSINSTIDAATKDKTSKYAIQEDSLISSDVTEDSLQDNQFFVFIKSFIVIADNQTDN